MFEKRAYHKNHFLLYRYTYPFNEYLSLPIVLNREGYLTAATHGNIPGFWNRQQAYKNQGYYIFYHSEHPVFSRDEMIGMGISDESIFKQMVDVFKDKKGPVYNFNFIISLSVHRPFVLPEEYQLLDLPVRFEDTPTGHYLQSVFYFDKALGGFINKLKEEYMWDDTIFVVYGDHYGPIPKDQEEIKKINKYRL